MSEGLERHSVIEAMSAPWRRRNPRRVFVASTLAATLSGGFLVLAAQVPQASAWATAIGLAALVLASVALSTFIPAQGPLRRLHLGCGPCAALGGPLALGAVWIAVADPGALSSATLALGAAGVAFVQRLTEPSSCPSSDPWAR